MKPLSFSFEVVKLIKEFSGLFWQPYSVHDEAAAAAVALGIFLIYITACSAVFKANFFLFFQRKVPHIQDCILLERDIFSLQFYDYLRCAVFLFLIAWTLAERDMIVSLQPFTIVFLFLRMRHIFFAILWELRCAVFLFLIDGHWLKMIVATPEFFSWEWVGCQKTFLPKHSKFSKFD